MIAEISLMTPASLSLRLVLAMSTTASLLRVGAFRYCSLGPNRLRAASYRCEQSHYVSSSDILRALDWVPCTRRTAAMRVCMTSGLTKTAITNMRVKELREALESRGLDTSGLRPVLLARLREAAETERTLKRPVRWRQTRSRLDVSNARALHTSSNENHEKEELLGGEGMAANNSNTASLELESAGKDVTICESRSSTHILQFDGASRGNPGPSGAGAVLYRLDNSGRRTEVWNGVFWLGEATTNNQAEYSGLIAGMVAANRLGIKRLSVEGDSKLVIEQMLGNYKVSSAKMTPLYQRAKVLAKTFDDLNLVHIRRALNGRADSLANMAMDTRQSGSTKAPLSGAVS